MDEWMGRWMDTWTIVWMDGLIGRSMYRWVDAKMDGWGMDG